MLERERSRNVGRRLCSALSEFAGSVFDTDEQWEGLYDFVLFMAAEEDGLKQEFGYRILNQTFTFTYTTYIQKAEQLLGTYKATLKGQFMNAKVALLESLGCLLSIVEREETVMFRPLLDDLVLIPLHLGNDEDSVGYK